MVSPPASLQPRPCLSQTLGYMGPMVAAPPSARWGVGGGVVRRVRGGYGDEGFARATRGLAAFAGKYEVDVNDPEACIECAEAWPAIVVLGVLAVVVALFVVAYARQAVRHPEAMKRWVSTLTILLTHFQSLKIITSLRLPWPASVRGATTVFGIDVVGMELPGANPGCLIGMLGDGGSIYVKLTLGKLAVLTLLTVAPYLASSAAELLSRYAATPAAACWWQTRCDHLYRLAGWRREGRWATLGARGRARHLTASGTAAHASGKAPPTWAGQ